MSVMATSLEHVDKFLQDFQECTEKVQNFVLPQQSLRKSFCQLTKHLYDEGCSAVWTKQEISALPKLITKNFDDEQIWQQIELVNHSIIPTLVDKISKTVVKQVNNLGLGIKAATQNVDGDHNYVDVGDDVTSDTDNEISFKVGPVESRVRKCETPRRKQLAPKSEVEDRFFSLSQLEKFLNREDAKEEKRNQNVESSDESSSDVDYFESVTSNEEDNETQEHKNASYKDFFDPPMEEEGNEHAIDEVAAAEEEEEEEGDSSRESEEEEQLSDMEYDTRDVEDKVPTAEDLWSSRTRDLLPASDSDKSDESDSENEKTTMDSKSTSPPVEKIKSNFQKQQDKLKEKISQLEDHNLSEKPWQLKGEVTAENRPENSLLEEHLQFEHVVRQAPVVTEETTKTLEEIILQRIKDKAWDDVERKVKPQEVPFEYKRRVVLDQEKSKMSLAEIYEKEYLAKQQSEKEEKQVPEHTEIKKAMTDLFYKLDSLSNFHYLPKTFSSEIKLVNNLPAFSVEEVAPVNVSEAGLLAPEEIQDKLKGELKGQTEKASTDRKRERRSKKLFQRKLYAAKERKKLKLKPSLQTKYSREEAKKQKTESKEVLADGKKQKVKSLTSSSAFFEKLQDKVHSEVQSHLRKRPSISDKKSKKFKL